MARQCNAKALTRFEVLVVVLVGAFFLSLLPAMSRRAKSDAARKSWFSTYCPAKN